MLKEVPTCRTYGYRYILALPSHLRRVLVLVHWKYILLHNTRKMCITHYSGKVADRLQSQTQIQVDKSIFVRIRKFYSYFQRPHLKIHSDQQWCLDYSSASAVSLASD